MPTRTDRRPPGPPRSTDAAPDAAAAQAASPVASTTQSANGAAAPADRLGTSPADRVHARPRLPASSTLPSPATRTRCQSAPAVASRAEADEAAPWWGGDFRHEPTGPFFDAEAGLLAAALAAHRGAPASPVHWPTAWAGGAASVGAAATLLGVAAGLPSPSAAHPVRVVPAPEAPNRPVRPGTTVSPSPEQMSLDGSSGSGASPVGAGPPPPAEPVAPAVQAFYGKQALWRAPAWFAANGFVDPTTGKLQSFKYLATPSWVWVLGRTAFSGSYGKVHLAAAASFGAPALAQVAIKEQRQRYKPPGADGLAKTYARAVEEIYGEIDDFRTLRAAIEAYCGAWEVTFAAQGHDPLAAVRAGTTPTLVHDAYTDPVKQKTYMAMTLELGSADMLVADVQRLVQALGPRSAQLDALVASFAAQSYLELSGLHSLGARAHLDLKLANVTFSRQGQFKLVDFGLAAPLDAGGATDRAGLDTGSLLCPEMVLPGLSPASGGLGLDPVGRATDVHALAATTLELLAGAQGRSPFNKAKQAVAGLDATGAAATHVVDDVTACQNQMLDLQQLELALQQPQVVQALLKTTDPVPLLQGAMPMAEAAHVAFFAACFARAPALTMTLLQGLRRDPAHRPDALAMASALSNYLPLPGDPVGARLRGYFATHPAAERQDAAFAELRRFEGLLVRGA